MAAYAAVVSLMNTIDDILNHPLHSFCLDKTELESLRMIIGFLQEFMECYNPGGGIEEEEALESLIASEAHAAEDSIESHVVRQILLGSKGDQGQTSSSSLHGVITDVNAVKEKVVEFKERKELKDVQPSSSSMPLSLDTAKIDMVGFEDESIQLMDVLTGQQPDLQIVSIVGMGGIGKTTLAKNVYENLVIIQHFDICAWATISQNCSLKQTLCELLSFMVNRNINKRSGEFACETDQVTEDQLGLKVYQSLLGRRYLIVLDDVWSVQTWDKLKCYFPDDGCRSRVVMTSRITNVTAHLSSCSFGMKLLDEDKCWKLFCREVFQGSGCPHELEEIGKKVVRECRGLPLSIVVIGGHLRSSPRTREHWESFARDIKSSLMSGNGDCLDILSLSYYHLPAHLKPCFLYMGVYVEGAKIDFSQLVKFFVANGFLRPNNEEMAEDNLRELIDRNLISVGGSRWTGRIKYLKIHDLVREVCVRIAEKEKFLFRGMRVIQIRPDIHGDQQIAYVNYIPPRFDSLQSLSFKCWFMRVLAQVDFDCLESTFQQVHVRFLIYNPSSSLNPDKIPSKLPSSISLLWNLQTLVIAGFTRFHAPPEIWHMRQLRHIKINELLLPCPPQDDARVLGNLQTLSRVVNFSFTEEACKRLPNIKKLRITYHDSEECQKCYYHLSQLHKLQSLNCSFHGNLKRGDLLVSLVFPTSLRKLCLQNCRLHWADLNAFGLSMPHLEVLKLGEGAAVGPEWDAVEGAFPRLKFLHISSCGDLIKWTAESSDFFPVLEKLGLCHLKKLDKIPSGIGEIHTLRCLLLSLCSESAAISSTDILEEHLDCGNEELEVLIVLKSDEEKKWLNEKAESKSFTLKNFVAVCDYDIWNFLESAE